MKRRLSEKPKPIIMPATSVLIIPNAREEPPSGISAAQASIVQSVSKRRGSKCVAASRTAGVRAKTIAATSPPIRA